MIDSVFIISGTFGQIYQGVLLSKDENEIGNEQDIYVKTVTGMSNVQYNFKKLKHYLKSEIKN